MKLPAEEHESTVPIRAGESRRKGAELPPAPEGADSLSNGNQGHRWNGRYAKRHLMRSASHRGGVCALERALRRAQVPVVFSAGFSPHPKVFHTGVALRGAAREAKCFELTLTEPIDLERPRVRLDEEAPSGVDSAEAVPVTAGGLADRLEASEWRIESPDVAPNDVAATVAVSHMAERVGVERLAKKRRRRFDRSPVPRLVVNGRAVTEQHETYAILRLIVRHTTSAVRPDDVVTDLRQVAGLAPPSSSLMTRLAQGPLDEASGDIADPLAAYDAASDAGATAVSAHAESAYAWTRTGNVSAPQGL